MARIRYMVPGYNMDQDDVDSLAAWFSTIPDLTEFDHFAIMPIPRRRDGTRIEV